MLAKAGLTLCKQCLFWDQHGTDQGLCRRHAPATSDQQLQVARWPETRALEGCGDGAPAGDAQAGQGQICKTCAFWVRPGQGIDPGLRGDHLAAWWREAGVCRRFAPRPLADIGSRAFWRATHSSDHCFDGQPT